MFGTTLEELRKDREWIRGSLSAERETLASRRAALAGPRRAPARGRGAPAGADCRPGPLIERIHIAKSHLPEIAAGAAFGLSALLIALPARFLGERCRSPRSTWWARCESCSRAAEPAPACLPAQLGPAAAEPEVTMTGAAPDTIRKQARFAGLLYLAMTLTAPDRAHVRPRDPDRAGNATLTAEHLRTSETLFRDRDRERAVPPERWRCSSCSPCSACSGRSARHWPGRW